MKARKVIVTGPESTGKTVLCEYLAEFFKGVCVPEYARFYVEQLGRPYTKRDVIIKFAGCFPSHGNNSIK